MILIFFQKRGGIHDWQKEMNVMEVTSNQVVTYTIWKRIESSLVPQVF